MLEPTADAGEPAPKAATAPSAVGSTESAGPQAENRYGLKAYEGRAPIKPEFLLKLKPRVPKQTQVVQREAEAEAGSEAALAPGAEAQAGDAVDPQTASTSEPPAKRSRRAEKREKKKWKSALEANKMCSLLIRKGEVSQLLEATTVHVKQNAAVVGCPPMRVDAVMCVRASSADLLLANTVGRLIRQTVRIR